MGERPNGLLDIAGRGRVKRGPKRLRTVSRGEGPPSIHGFCVRIPSRSWRIRRLAILSGTVFKRNQGGCLEKQDPFELLLARVFHLPKPSQQLSSQPPPSSKPSQPRPAIAAAVFTASALFEALS